MLARLRAKTPLLLLALIVALAVLAGCGSNLKGGPTATASQTSASSECPQVVMKTLSAVLGRIYHEGVSSERTASAEHLIGGSAALRQAIEAGSASQARAAAQALLKTGHLTNLRVTARGRVLVSVGGPALTPLRGAIKSASGATIATYLFSVWSDSGFASESSGVAEGLIALRAGGRSIGGSVYLPAGTLPQQGTVTRRGVEYEYTSFPGQLYPSGAVEIYVLKPLAEIQKLCGATADDTVVNTLGRVADLIYAAEAGPRTLVQIHRVQDNAALLHAVAEENIPATTAAVAALLHHHLVRLRVLSRSGRLLDDDGGPYVLAPVHASLRLNGRIIGHIVLSIQDDEGYEKLARRLAGLDVLMYMAPLPGSTAPRLVKNDLGPGVGGPQSVPASGSYTYRGKEFRVLTVHATAFPSGPLTIRVLIPIPYS